MLVTHAAANEARRSLLSLGGLVAVAQVATVREVQTHEPAMGRHNGLVNLKVGRAATQALNVDTPLVLSDVEGSKSTALAEELNLVNVLVATVVALAWVALGVLVRHRRTKGIEDSPRRNILGGDKDDGLALTLDLVFLFMELVMSQWYMRGASSCHRGMYIRTYHDLSDLRVGVEKRLLKHLRENTPCQPNAILPDDCNHGWQQTNLLMSSRQCVSSLGHVCGYCELLW